MSLHYLIDGYNAINKIPSLRVPELQKARELLVSHIRAESATLRAQNRITVVFDSKESYSLGGQVNLVSGVSVVFSKGISADDAIIDMVRNAPNPKIMVAVSDDNGLCSCVRSLGGNVMSVADYFRRLDKNKEMKPQDKDEKLSAAQERKITEELAKLWLRKE